MNERDVETIVQRALEKFPGREPRIISDNGPQFIAKDFKEFIRICGHDARSHEPVLSAIERQAGALARQPQTRVRAACVGSPLRRGSTSHCVICGPLQQHAAAQCPGLRDAGRQAGRAGKRDLRRARSQAGGSASSIEATVRRGSREVA